MHIMHVVELMHSMDLMEGKAKTRKKKQSASANKSACGRCTFQ